MTNYLGASWHVTQVIVTKEGVDRCLFWIAENLPRTIPLVIVQQATLEIYCHQISTILCINAQLHELVTVFLQDSDSKEFNVRVTNVLYELHGHSYHGNFQLLANNFDTNFSCNVNITA